MASLVAVLAGVPSTAAARIWSLTEHESGSLTITWTGDPAHGCAAVGVCGVNGSIQVLSQSGTFGEGSNRRFPLSLQIGDQSTVAREVTLGTGGQVESECADAVPINVTFNIVHAGGVERAVSQADGGNSSPSAGRCPGPTALDLAKLSIPARYIGSNRWDLSGTTTSRVGPFDVTLDSTLRMWAKLSVSNGNGSVGPGGLGPPPPVIHKHQVLQEYADVTYRVAGTSGALTQTFAGLPSPACETLGACGASGTLSEQLTLGGVLDFFGDRTVGRAASARRALADLRAGHLSLGYGTQFPILSTLTESVTSPNTGACTDTASFDARNATLFGSARSAGRDTQILEIDSQAGEFPGSGPDPLRTRCEGPSVGDVLGSGGVFARTALSVHQLGADHLILTFSRPGAFTGSAYTGTRAGSIVVDLTRVRERAGTRRITEYGYPPGAAR